MIADATVGSDNEDRMDTFLGHFPRGASLKDFMHFTQLLDSKKF